jgi:hypothetical protein
MSLSSKEEFVLRVLSLLHSFSFSPIQVQKLFFLLEKRIGKEAQYFKFTPYHYGPYDEELTTLLAKLERQERITSSIIDGIKHYSINQQLDIGGFLDEKKKNFILNDLVPFIKSKSFFDLCYSIYKEFPEMAKRSVLIKKPQ